MTTKKSSRTKKSAGAPTFEASIARLNDIVEALETGDLPLEESLSLVEEGISLAKKSQATLDKAEKRVEELLEVNAEGEAITRPFHTDDLADEGG